jgi:hypothetical protein
MSKLTSKLDSISLKDKLGDLLESIDKNNTSKMIVDRYYKRLATLEINEGVSASYSNSKNPYASLDRINLLENLTKELRSYDWVSEVKTFVNESTSFLNENRSYILVESVIRDLKSSKQSGYYSKAIEKLTECTTSDNVDFKVTELLESEVWIPLVKRLYEYCNKSKSEANGTNPNFKVSKIYSPVTALDEGFLFHSNGKNLIVLNDTIEESKETPSSDFINMIKITENSNIKDNTIRMYPNQKSLVDITFEKENVTVSIDGEVVENDHIESKMLTKGIVKLNEQDKISNIYRAIKEGRSIKEIDFGYKVTSSVFEGLSVSVFTINENVYIQKMNKGMKVNTITLAENAIDAVSIVKDFMNYDITESIKSLVESKTTEVEKKNEEIQTIESRINFLNEKIEEINAAEKTIGSSDILENAKKLLEDEITTQNVELEKAKGEYSNESELSEDRAKEIESDTVEAGKPRPAGEAGETNKKYGFDSPQEDTKKEDKTKVEIEGNNDEVVVKENEETTEESIKENCTVGSEYKIDGKAGYIYQGDADGIHIFNQKNETDPTPLHMKDEEFKKAHDSGRISE